MTRVPRIASPTTLGRVQQAWITSSASDLVFHFKPVKPQNRRRTSTWVGYRKEYVEAKWSDATKPTR